MPGTPPILVDTLLAMSRALAGHVHPGAMPTDRGASSSVSTPGSRARRHGRVSEVAELLREAIWVVFEDVSADDWYVAGRSVAASRRGRRRTARGRVHPMA